MTPKIYSALTQTAIRAQLARENLSAVIDVLALTQIPDETGHDADLAKTIEAFTDVSPSEIEILRTAAILLRQIEDDFGPRTTRTPRRG